MDFRPLTTLLDRLRGLGSSRVLEEVLVLVMDSAIDATGAERGFIMLANPKGELEFKIARARGKVTLSGKSFATSQKIPQEVFATGRERIVADLRDGDVAGQHLGTVALGIRHVLCTPLRVVRYLEQSSHRGRAASDRRAVSRQPREGAVDVGRRAQRARGSGRRSGVGDRERAAVSRSDREGADRARAPARRRNPARAAARGAAIRAALRRRCVVDPVPLDRRRLLRLLQPRGRALRASRSATSRARDLRRRC